MFGSLERSIAWRYLRARREEGFISVIAFLSLLGIMLGVATLIIVMSVMNGFRAELIDKIVGVNSHITVLPQGRKLNDYERVSDAIERIPGVTRAAPVVEAQVFASSPAGGSGAIVRGLRPADMLTLDGVSVEPERSRGSLNSFASGRGVAIGEGVARRLGMAVGDSVKLISPRGASRPFGVVPRSRSYDVIYIFKTGMFGYDDAMMFLPLSEAQNFFNRAETADAVEVTVATPDKLDGYAVDIEAAVDAPVTVTDWKQANSGIIGALKTEATVMFVILSLLILLAALIIISGLVMLVKEKGRGIAILRTMGLSRGSVTRIFFLAGATIGVVGTIMGVGLGVAFTLNIQEIKAGVELVLGVKLFPENVYGLSSLPARLLLEDVILTVSVALGVSFLATIYPAWRAARLDPVEALRYE